MFDLVIRGDCVVAPHGVDALDIAVKGEKIVAVAAAGTFEADSTRRLLDVRGKIVMPGGIDPHVHCSWSLAYLDGTAFLSDPPLVVSKAALYGGTTTLLDFARWNHGE